MAEETAKAFKAVLATVDLTDGERLELPRLTLRRILLVTDTLAKMIEKLQAEHPEVMTVLLTPEGSVNLRFGSFIVANLHKILPTVMHEVYDFIVVYTGKDRAWVDEHVDLDDTVAILTPFFTTISTQLSGLINRYAPPEPVPVSGPLNGTVTAATPTDASSGSSPS